MNSLNTIKRPFNYKVPLFVAGGLVLLVALGLGGLLFVSNQATTEYAAKLEVVSNGLKQKLESGQNKFEEAAKTKDTQQTTTAIRNMTESLETQLDTVPTDPQILGVQLVGQAARDTKAELIAKTRALITAFEGSASLLNYQKNVFEAVLKVKDLTGNNQAEQEQLSAQWSDLVGQLKNIVPPKPAELVHEQLVESAVSIQSSLAALPELFKNKDQANFSAKQKEIDSKIAGLRALSEPLAQAGLDQDKATADAYRQLTALLQ